VNDALVEELVRRVLAELERREPDPPPTCAGGAAAASPAPAGLPLPAPWPPKAVAVGADHGGYERKEQIARWLAAAGYRVVDCGTNGTDPVDYPDFAAAVARQVASGRCEAGVIVDGAGIGSAMAANKVPGVRCATVWSPESVRNARGHNDANVIALGSGFVAFPLARRLVELFLKTPHGGGRHLRRVAKIVELER
jgi:ribose 5-phosphate isomerase B